MSEEFQKVLFDPFTQEYRADSAEARGSGLGLAITKRLIDAMGGAVAVTSRPGKGTAFGADFRLDCIPAGGAAEQAQPGGGAGKSLAGRHILLCEDHPLNQEIAKAILEGQGALVTIAGDGESGVRAFLGSSIGYYDCILMTAFAREDAGDREKLLHDLSRIEASNTFLLSLINDVLDISKIDSGKIELHPEPYRFREFIDSIRSIFEPLCAQNGQTFRLLCGEYPVGCGVVVDRIRYNQIALNLLSNAVKYTPAGGTVTYSSHSRRLPGGMVTRAANPARDAPPATSRATFSLTEYSK